MTFRAALLALVLATSASAAPVPPAPPVEVRAVGCWEIAWGSASGFLWLHPGGRFVLVLEPEECPTVLRGRWWVDRAGCLVLVDYEADAPNKRRVLPPAGNGWRGDGCDRLPMVIEGRRPLAYYPR